MFGLAAAPEMAMAVPSADAERRIAVEDVWAGIRTRASRCQRALGG